MPRPSNPSKDMFAPKGGVADGDREGGSDGSDWTEPPVGDPGRDPDLSSDPRPSIVSSGMPVCVGRGGGGRFERRYQEEW